MKKLKINLPNESECRWLVIGFCIAFILFNLEIAVIMLIGGVGL